LRTGEKWTKENTYGKKMIGIYPTKIGKGGNKSPGVINREKGMNENHRVVRGKQTRAPEPTRLRGKFKEKRRKRQIQKEEKEGFQGGKPTGPIELLWSGR